MIDPLPLTAVGISVYKHAHQFATLQPGTIVQRTSHAELIIGWADLLQLLGGGRFHGFMGGPLINW